MHTAAIADDLNWIPSVVEDESFAMALAVVMTCLIILLIYTNSGSRVPD